MEIKVRKVLAFQSGWPSDLIISGAMHSDSGQWTLRRTSRYGLEVPGTYLMAGR